MAAVLCFLCFPRHPKVLLIWKWPPFLLFFYWLRIRCGQAIKRFRQVVR